MLSARYLREICELRSKSVLFFSEIKKAIPKGHTEAIMGTFSFKENRQTNKILTMIGTIKK